MLPPRFPHATRPSGLLTGRAYAILKLAGMADDVQNNIPKKAVIKKLNKNNDAEEDAFADEIGDLRGVNKQSSGQ